jgi:SRSO17 transposase
MPIAHHLVADAPWEDDAILRQVRYRVLPVMTRRSPMVAWVVDDTGFPKEGLHSVSVARQHCGRLRKQDNCRVAVSVSVSTWTTSLPVAWRLCLPEAWADDRARRQKTGSSDTIADDFSAAPRRTSRYRPKRSRWLCRGAPGRP